MQLIGILILLLCLIGASAFFSSSETAFLSITKIQIRQMLKEKIPSAKRISLLKNDMDKVLTTILIGNNFVNNLASSTATALAISLVGEKGVTTATIIMTIVIITFGEILPKTISTYMPEKMAKYFSLPLLILQKIMFPVVWIFSRLTKGVGFIVDKLWKSNTPLITEEELKTLIEVGNAEGTLENNEKEMLYKIFEFTDLRVRDITRHRSFVQGIPAEASYFEAAQLFSKSGYSRLPVYSTNSGKENSTDEYIGLLHYKTLLFFNGDKTKVNFAKENMRQVLFIPETKTAVSLLHTFKSEKANFAIVVDEHGTNSGIVTMDDILNAVMGRITDEYTKEMNPEKRIKILSPTDFLLPGDLKLIDVNNIFQLKCESDDFDTLGGWLLERFGYLPSTGEILKTNFGLFIIEDTAQRRIKMVRLKLNQ